MSAGDDSRRDRDTPGKSSSDAGERDSFDALLEAAVSPSDASELGDPRPTRFERLAIGTAISGRFVVEWFAGAGGMGDVYRCRDTDTRDAIALKVIRRLDNQGRFKREASILAALSHPAIVRYVAHGSTETGTPFLAMEWLDGEDLGRRLARGKLSIAESVALARRMCEGLAVAHGHGFVHRDIKPSNVFLVGGSVDAAKLLDFGIAHRGAATQTATRAGTVLGTVGYMAPEQASGMRLPDPRADLFSLGCVLFECLTGEPAFAGENTVAVLESLLSVDAPELTALRPEVPPELAQLVRSLLSKRREARPPDAASVIGILAEVEAARRAAHPGRAEVDRTGWLARPIGLASLVRGRAVARDLGGEGEPGLAVLAARFGATSAMKDGADAVLSFEVDHATGVVDAASRALACALALARARPDLTVRVRTGLVTPDAAASDEDEVHASASAPGGVAIDELTAALCASRTETEHGRLPEGVLVTGDAAYVAAPGTPFVGRETELAVLDAVLDECVDEGVARAVLGRGSAGVGASRVLDAFGTRVAAHGTVRVLSARTSFEARAEPLSLARALARADGCPPEEAASLDEPALMALLARRARTAPLVVCIDEAQWADPPSMLCLESAIAALAEHPVLLVGFTRSDMPETLRGVWRRLGAQDLHVRKLTDRAAERLARSLAAGELRVSPLTTGVAVAIADGNARLLCALTRAELGLGVAGRDVATALLHEGLMRLPDAERAALCAASMFREHAWAGGIEAILEGRPLARRALTALCERKLLARQQSARFAKEDAYGFSHVLVREAARRMIDARDRRSARERAAGWLTESGARDVERLVIDAPG